MVKNRLLFMLFFTGIILLLVLLMQPLSVFHFREYIAVLFPKGIIALEAAQSALHHPSHHAACHHPCLHSTFIFSWKYQSRQPQRQI